MISSWVRLLYVFLFYLSCLGTGYTHAIADDKIDIPFTQNERAWLEKHPTIRVGIDPKFQPYEFLNNQGQYIGISQDYLALLSKHLGIKFKIVRHHTWSEVMKAAKAQQIDLLTAVSPTPKRLAFLNFTQPFIRYKTAIVSQWDSYQINGLSDLQNQTVALVKNYALSELILRKVPSIKPLYVDTLLDGLKAVSNHQAVAIVSDLGSVAYKIRQYKMTHLEVASLVDLNSKGFSMAVRKDWPILISILNKALAAIPEKTHQEILQRWVPIGYKTKLQFTGAEETFLKTHPVIHLGIDPEFAPFEFMDDAGYYRGMTSEYIQLLEHRLGIRFKIKKGISWEQAIEQAKQKKLDVLPAVGQTQERTKHFIFSKPYLQFHRVIISRVDSPFLTGIQDIQHLRVAVQKGSSHEGFLQDNTTIQPIHFNTLQATLQAVADGRVDVLVGNVASCAYWIRKMNLTNLKVAAPVSNDLQNLYFAVRNDWPELISAINKGLDSITFAQRQRISEKWIPVQYDPITDYTLLWKILFAFAFVIIIFTAWMLYVQKQRRLLKQSKDEVLNANQQLQTLQSHLEILVKERTDALIASEHKFRQAQKMEALGTLVSGIAHDFNNILAGISGNTYLLLNELNTQPKAMKKLERIDLLSNRAANLIRQMLTFARKDTVRMAPLNLTPLIQEVFTLLRTSIPENMNIQLNIHCDNILINADSTQIHQVLLNLVNNARDAIEKSPNPHITISVDTFNPDTVFIEKHPHFKTQKYAHIYITDNGCGIPNKDIEHLFEPFFTTKEVGKGTGLGLAMVFGAIKRHQGYIEVESSQGKGTTFHVYLPLCRSTKNNPVPQQQAIAAATGNHELILLVDDDQQILEMGNDLLVSLGYQVVIAKDGEEAIAVFQQHKEIALIITDIVMPKLGGIAAVERIRQICPNIPVIFSTGYDKNVGETERITAENEAILNKPYQITALQQLIQQKLHA